MAWEYRFVEKDETYELWNTDESKCYTVMKQIGVCFNWENDFELLQHGEPDHVDRWKEIEARKYKYGKWAGRSNPIGLIVGTFDPVDINRIANEVGYLSKWMKEQDHGDAPWSKYQTKGREK